MAIELEGLEFQISAEGGKSVKQLDRLANSLSKLRTATQGLRGLDTLKGKLEKLNNALSGFHTDKLDSLAKGLTALNNAGNTRISPTIPKRISEIAQASSQLKDEDITRLESLANALQTLGAAGNVRIPHLRNTNVGNELNQQAGEGTTPPTPDTSGIEEATSEVQEYSNAADQATGRTNILKPVLSGIGGVFSKGFSVGAGVLKELGHGLDTAAGAAKRLIKQAALLPITLGSKLAASVKQTTSSLGGLFSSLKRIAMYRAIRAAIAALTQGFKEGINNLYQYSTLMGTQFAQSMNNLSSSALYLKNSLAAMAAPIINAIAPAIDFVIDKIVTLFNLLNQLFARLTGKSTYTAAKKVEAAYGGAADKVGGAAKKALKSFTIGIDELNIIEDKMNSGGGGGGGGGGADYGSMFEELPIDDNISDFADKLKEAFDNADWKTLGTLLGDKVNEIVDSVDWSGLGHKIGYGINAAVQTAYWFLDTVDFTNIGKHLAELFNGGIEEIDFEYVGRLMMKGVTILPDIIIGFLSELNWGLVARSFSDFVIGVFDEGTKWLNKYDWKELGTLLYNKLKDAITNIDFAGIAQSFFTFLGTALRSAIQFLGGFFGSLGADIKKWWDEEIKGQDWKETAGNLLTAIGKGFLNIGSWVVENIVDPFCNALLGENVWSGIKDAGKNIIEGLFEGIKNFFSDPLGWLKTHIVDPFVEGFKNLFGIASPSTVMEELGGFITEGLLNGILAPFKAIAQWVKTNLFDPLKKAIEDSPVVKFAVGVINSAKQWWENVKSWWAGVSENGLSVSALVGLVKSGWTTVKNWIGSIPVVSQAVNLIKSGWTTIKNWVGRIPVVSQAVNLIKSGWTTVKGWIGNIPTLSQAINLIKSGWTTVKNWVGHIPTLDQAIKLIKSGWTTVKAWIGNIPVLSQAIQLIKSGWTTVKAWIGNIPVLDQAIKLIKSGWTTVKGWIGDIPILSQGIQLIKSGWTTVKGWIGNIPTLDQAIQLVKSGWTTVKNWIGSIPMLEQAIGLAKSGWTTVKGWIGNLPVIDQAIKLTKSGWTTISNFIGTATSVAVSLTKSGWSSISSWIGDKVSVGISLFKSGWNSIKSFFGLGDGGIIGANGGVKAFASGGVIDGGFGEFWNRLPKYAGGTANAHGSMFVAGERGAELVGHVNGRTEVLNKSQLGQVMHRSIVDGMSQFATYWQAVNSHMTTCANGIISAMLLSADAVNATIKDPESYQFDSLYSWMEQINDRMENGQADGSKEQIVSGVRDGVLEATAEQNALLREQNNLLLRLADKQTIVQIGNKTIKDAVVTQEKADGYRFTK